MTRRRAVFTAALTPVLAGVLVVASLGPVPELPVAPVYAQAQPAEPAQPAPKAAAAAPSVTIPKEVRVAVGRLAVVEAAFDGADFRYVVIGEVDAFREYAPGANTVRLRVLGYVPGTASVVAYCARGDAASPPAVCTVIVGEPAPPVPPRPPTPPTPPDPPGPDPFGPKPDAELVAALAAAYQAETSANKAKWLAQLTELYRTAPEKELRDPQLKTLSDVLSRLTAVRRGLMADGEFLGVRNAVAVWLQRQLPADPGAAVLDDALRKKAGGTFAVLAASLKEVR